MTDAAVPSFASVHPSQCRVTSRSHRWAKMGPEGPFPDGRSQAGAPSRRSTAARRVASTVRLSAGGELGGRGLRVRATGHGGGADPRPIIPSAETACSRLLQDRAARWSARTTAETGRFTTGLHAPESETAPAPPPLTARGTPRQPRRVERACSQASNGRSRTEGLDQARQAGWTGRTHPARSSARMSCSRITRSRSGCRRSRGGGRKVREHEAVLGHAVVMASRVTPLVASPGRSSRTAPDHGVPVRLDALVRGCPRRGARFSRLVSGGGQAGKSLATWSCRALPVVARRAWLCAVAAQSARPRGAPGAPSPGVRGPGTRERRCWCRPTTTVEPLVAEEGVECGRGLAPICAPRSARPRRGRRWGVAGRTGRRRRRTGWRCSAGPCAPPRHGRRGAARGGFQLHDLGPGAEGRRATRPVWSRLTRPLWRRRSIQPGTLRPTGHG